MAAASNGIGRGTSADNMSEPSPGTSPVFGGRTPTPAVVPSPPTAETTGRETTQEHELTAEEQVNELARQQQREIDATGGEQSDHDSEPDPSNASKSSSRSSRWPGRIRNPPRRFDEFMMYGDGTAGRIKPVRKSRQQIRQAYSTNNLYPMGGRLTEEQEVQNQTAQSNIVDGRETDNRKERGGKVTEVLTTIVQELRQEGWNTKDALKEALERMNTTAGRLTPMVMVNGSQLLPPTMSNHSTPNEQAGAALRTESNEQPPTDEGNVPKETEQEDELGTSKENIPLEPEVTEEDEDPRQERPPIGEQDSDNSQYILKMTAMPPTEEGKSDVRRYALRNELEVRGRQDMGENGQRKLELIEPPEGEEPPVPLSLAVLIEDRGALLHQFKERFTTFLQHRGSYTDGDGQVMRLVQEFSGIICRELAEKEDVKATAKAREFLQEIDKLKDEVGKAQNSAEVFKDIAVRDRRYIQLKKKHEQEQTAVLTGLEEENQVLQRDVGELREENNSLLHDSRELQRLRDTHGVHSVSCESPELTQVEERLKSNVPLHPEEQKTTGEAIRGLRKQLGEVMGQRKRLEELISQADDVAIVTATITSELEADKAQLVERLRQIEEDKDFDAIENRADNLKLGRLMRQVQELKEANQTLEQANYEQAQFYQRREQGGQTDRASKEALEKERREHTRTRTELRKARDERDIHQRTAEDHERIKKELEEAQLNVNELMHTLESLRQELNSTKSRERQARDEAKAVEREYRAKINELEEPSQKLRDEYNALLRSYDRQTGELQRTKAIKAICVHPSCTICNPVLHQKDDKTFVCETRTGLEATARRDDSSKDPLQMTDDMKDAKQRVPAPTLDDLFKMTRAQVLEYKGVANVAAFEKDDQPPTYSCKDNSDPWEWGDKLIAKVRRNVRSEGPEVQADAAIVMYIRRELSQLMDGRAVGYLNLFYENHGKQDIDFFQVLQVFSDQLAHRPCRITKMENIKQRKGEKVDDFYNRLLNSAVKIIPGDQKAQIEARGLAVALSLINNCLYQYIEPLKESLDYFYTGPSPDSGQTNTQYRNTVINKLRLLERKNGNVNSDIRKNLHERLLEDGEMRPIEANGDKWNAPYYPPPQPGVRGEPGGQSRGRGFNRRGPVGNSRLRPPMGYRGGSQRGRPNTQYPNPLHAPDGSWMNDACWVCFQSGHSKRECPFGDRRGLCLKCGNSENNPPHDARTCNRQPATREYRGVTLTWRPISQTHLDWDRARYDAERGGGLNRQQGSNINRGSFNNRVAAINAEEAPLNKRQEEQVDAYINNAMEAHYYAVNPDERKEGNTPRVYAAQVGHLAPNGDGNQWPGPCVCVDSSVLNLPRKLKGTNFVPTWENIHNYARIAHEKRFKPHKCPVDVEKALIFATPEDLEYRAKIAEIIDPETLKHQVANSREEFERMAREGIQVINLRRSETPVVYCNQDGDPKFQYPTLVDTGADVSLIPAAVLTALGIKEKDIYPCGHANIKGVGGQILGIKGCVAIPLLFGGTIPLYHTFHVMENNNNTGPPFILGIDFLENVNPSAKLNITKRRIKIGKQRVPWGNPIRSYRAPVVLGEDVVFDIQSETRMAKVTVDDWCYGRDRVDTDLAMVLDPSMKCGPKLLRAIHGVQENPDLYTHVYHKKGTTAEMKKGQIIGWATLTPEKHIRAFKEADAFPKDLLSELCQDMKDPHVLPKLRAVLTDLLSPETLPERFTLKAPQEDELKLDVRPSDQFLDAALPAKRPHIEPHAPFPRPDPVESTAIFEKDDYNPDEIAEPLGGARNDDWKEAFKEGKPLQSPDINSVDWSKSVFTKEELIKVKAVLTEKLDAFGSDLRHLKRTTATEMTIETFNDQPIRARPYTMDEDRKVWFDQEIDTLLALKIVEPSFSQYAAGTVVAKKKGSDKWRLCCDYRGLNLVTKFDSYPAHNARHIFERLRQGVNYFASMDLMSGFWQVNLKKEDRHKTAFISHRGLLQWCIMPFGLKNSPSCFQRLMDIVFKDLIGAEGSGIFVYVDDVLLYCNGGIEDFCELLRNVCQRLIDYNLKAKLSKCEFGLECIKFLGHEISRNGIRPDAEKVQAVMELSIPKTIKALKTFLGMVTYYQMFLPGFAFYAVYLYQLTRGQAKFSNIAKLWNPNCQFAFEYIKFLMCERTLLYFPDLNSRFYINTDASDYGVGAELWQVDEKGQPATVAWVSKVFTRSMLKFSVNEKEGYALVFALIKFRPFLQGRKFTVYTDHKALVSMVKLKDPYRRIMRWTSYIQEFAFDVIFIRGRDNIVADALSRLERNDAHVSRVEVCERATANQMAPYVFSLTAIWDGDDQPTVVEMYNVNADCFSPLVREELYEAKEQLARTVRQKTATMAVYMPDGQSDFVAKQNCDPECRRIRGLLENGTPEQQRKLSQFLVVDSVLYRMTRSGRMTLVVPETVVSTILYGAHDSLFAGHLGKDKTRARLQDKFWWHRMEHDITEYIKCCEICQRTKNGKGKEKPFMRPIKPGRPFETIGVDCIGPLVESAKDNYKYVIIFIDHFTKWVEARALADLRTETVAKAFTELIVLRHGTPKRLLSDNATYFTSAKMDDLLRQLKVKQQFGAPYRPEAQGQVEVTNRTVKQIIRAYTNYKQDDWPVWLPFAIHAYRTSWCAAIKDTPFMLVHGRPCTNPDDVNNGIEQNLQYLGPEDYKRYVFCFMRFAHHAADIAIQETQQRYKYTYDKDKKPAVLQEGDPVWIMVPNRKKKTGNQLGPLWVGPARIVTRKGPRATVQYEDAQKKRKEPFWVYTGYLKKYFPPVTKQRRHMVVTEDEWKRVMVTPFKEGEIDPETRPKTKQARQPTKEEEEKDEMLDTDEIPPGDEQEMFERIHEDIVGDNKAGITRRSSRQRKKPVRFQAGN